MKKNTDFEYTYTAPTASERREIESIRSGYLKPSEPTSKMLELKKLDNRVKNTPTTISIVIGVIGLLVFGLGMSMILEWSLILFGSIVGITGLIIMGLACRLYYVVLSKMKSKYSSKIISLSNELLGERDVEDAREKESN